MAYSSWSVVYGEVPSAAKWNILGANDASFNDGTGLPVGTCVQTVYTNYSAVATGTGTIPIDDSIPQSSEGNEYMSQAITPRSATNILSIEILWHGSNSTNGSIAVALFQDSNVNAIAGMITAPAGAGYNVVIPLSHRMVAGTTSSTTFKVRAGAAAGTTTFNGASGSRFLGAITHASIIIREHTV